MTQTFKGAYKDKICVRMFIWMSAYERFNSEKAHQML
jgi:hypothetical protein